MDEIQVTTDEIGLLIRDMLGLNVEIDTAAGPDVGIDHVDDSDFSNLRVMLNNGQCFTIRVIAGLR